MQHQKTSSVRILFYGIMQFGAKIVITTIFWCIVILTWFHPFLESPGAIAAAAYTANLIKGACDSRVSQIGQPLLRKLSNIPYIVGNHPSQTDF